MNASIPDNSVMLATQHQFLFALEGTPGTLAAMNAANATMNVYDLKIENTTKSEERQALGTDDQLPSVPGAAEGSLSFYTHAVVGTSPAWLNLLRCAGMVSSSGSSGVTFTPLTGATQTASATLPQWDATNTNGARLKQLAGVSLDLTISGEAGKLVNIEAKGQGVWKGLGSVAKYAPTYETAPLYQFTGGSVTIGTNAASVSKFSLAFGNTVTPVEDGTAGYLFFMIGGRKTKLTLDPLAQVSNDFYTAYQNGAAAAVSLSCVNGAHTLTIAAPAAQQAKAPGEGDRGGKRVDELEFQANRVGAGDDSLVITVSA